MTPTRTLILAADTNTGFMAGEDVKAIQTRLRALGVAPTLLVDGEYGPATASAVARWKRYWGGYPDKMLAGGLANNLGVDGQLRILGAKKVNPLWLVRAAQRRAALKVTLTIGQRVIRNARRFVGLKEQPPGSNKQPEVIRAATDAGVHPSIRNMGYAWCALFVFLMWLTAGSKAARRALVDYAWNCLYTPTILAMALAGENGLRVIGWSEIQEGDPLLMNLPGGDPRVDHIGLAATPPRGDEVATIEGNTSSGVAGNQSDGGMVATRIRHKSVVRAAIRLAN